jgi:hypothetical protein
MTNSVICIGENRRGRSDINGGFSAMLPSEIINRVVHENGIER